MRYSYMDARRYAAKQGLTLRAPQKIWDSSLAAIGLLWAKRQGPAPERAYHDRVFERFWLRELDIEDPAVIEGELRIAGAELEGWADWSVGEGRTEHDRLRAEAEAMGIFGVPTFVFQGELFWGREHLDLLRERVLSA